MHRTLLTAHVLKGHAKGFRSECFRNVHGSMTAELTDQPVTVQTARQPDSAMRRKWTSNAIAQPSRNLCQGDKDDSKLIDQEVNGLQGWTQEVCTNIQETDEELNLSSWDTKKR